MFKLNTSEKENGLQSLLFVAETQFPLVLSFDPVYKRHFLATNNTLPGQTEKKFTGGYQVMRTVSGVARK